MAGARSSVLGRATVLSLLLGAAVACQPSAPVTVALPRPLTVSIDDCGWQSGASLAEREGPWRLGARDPELADYQRLGRIARRTGTRLLTLWVMSELDRTNICARPAYNRPEAPADMTEAGLSWDNSAHVSDGNFALMALLREEAAWLELGLHGVRHEHWEGGHRTRAEFGQRNGHGWGNRNTLLHLRCFDDLLRQYYPPEESRFPVSFVPPNHGYEDVGDGVTSTGAMLAAFGVRFAQKPGRTLFDHGVLWMGRDTSASPAYDAESTLPGAPPLDASWLMTHLPNFYGKEEAWVSWLRDVDATVKRWLPRNSAQAASQMLYAQHARFSPTSDGGRLDTRDLPAEAYAQGVLGPLVLKVALALPPEAEAARVDVRASAGLAVVARYRDAFHHEVLYLADPAAPQGAIRPGVYDLVVARDRDQETAHVELGNSTATVFSLARPSTSSAVLEVEAYGETTMDVVLPDAAVNAVESQHPGLRVSSWEWRPEAHLLHLTLVAHDLQGEHGVVLLGLLPEDAPTRSSLPKSLPAPLDP